MDRDALPPHHREYSIRQDRLICIHCANLRSKLLRRRAGVHSLIVRRARCCLTSSRSRCSLRRTMRGSEAERGRGRSSFETRQTGSLAEWHHTGRCLAASGLIIREITCQKTVKRRASEGGTEGEGTDIGEQGGEHAHMDGGRHGWRRAKSRVNETKKKLFAFLTPSLPQFPSLHFEPSLRSTSPSSPPPPPQICSTNHRKSSCRGKALRMNQRG